MLMAERLSPLKLFKRADIIVGRFSAMACSCEILLDTDRIDLARDLAHAAAQEACRIENKFSRYKEGNIVHKINSSGGRPVTVDDETAQLIDFAHRCFSLSGGLFDITSGVLRRAWTFDGSGRLPADEDVKAMLPLVGWNKVEWRRPVIRLSPGMEIDLGGIGKEYAVDRVLGILRERADIGVLVNFGGDIAIAGQRRDGHPWAVGIEDADKTDEAIKTLHVKGGAVATSGDAKKFLIKDGKRYGHILDPRTGRPVEGAPRSVTVAAATCTEAGFLSTFGILSGANADAMLTDAGVPHWCR